MRHPLSTVAVVALLVLSGCSAGGFGGGAQTETSSNETLRGDEPMYEAPLDGAVVAENHEAVIESAGTFTLASTTTQSRGDRSRTVNASVVANYDTGALRSTREAGSRTVTTFVMANGTAYQRFEAPSGEARYRAPRRAPNVSLFASGRLDAIVDAFEYSHVGTETVDGVETEVYEASGAQDLNESAPGFQNVDTENVTTLESRVYVTEDGLVKRLDYELGLEVEGSEMTVDVTQRYSNLGGTTVSTPDWLDEAGNSTSN